MIGKLIVFLLLVSVVFLTSWILDYRTASQASYSMFVENMLFVRQNIDILYKNLNYNILDLTREAIGQVEKDIKLMKDLRKLSITNLTSLLNTQKRLVIEEMVDIRDVHEFLDRLNSMIEHVGVEAANEYFIRLFVALMTSYGIILESFIFVLKMFVEVVALTSVVFADHTVRIFILYYLLLYFYTWIGEHLMAVFISNVRGLNYKTARWESQSLLRAFSQYGIFSFIHSGVFMWGMLRVVLIFLGLPHYLDFDLLYVIIILFIFSFWLSIKNMEHTVKYTLALRIDADATLKDTEEGRKWEKVLADNMLSRLYDGVFAPTPFLIRFLKFSTSNPLEGLSNIYGKVGTIVFILTFPFYIIIDCLLEAILQICVWSFLYLYLFPRVRNIKLNAKTIDLIRGVYNNMYYDIYGETINLNFSYFYTSFRLWAIICGYRSVGNYCTENPMSNLIGWFKAFRFGPQRGYRGFKISSSSSSEIPKKKTKINSILRRPKLDIDLSREDDNATSGSEPEPGKKYLKDVFTLKAKPKPVTIDDEEEPEYHAFDDKVSKTPAQKGVIRKKLFKVAEKKEEAPYFLAEDIELADKIHEDLAKDEMVITLEPFEPSLVLHYPPKSNVLHSLIKVENTPLIERMDIEKPGVSNYKPPGLPLQKEELSSSAEPAVSLSEGKWMKLGSTDLFTPKREIDLSSVKAVSLVIDEKLEERSTDTHSGSSSDHGYPKPREVRVIENEFEFKSDDNWRKEINKQDLKVKTLFVPPAFLTVHDAKDDLAAFCLFSEMPYNQIYAKVFSSDQGAISRYREWLKSDHVKDSYQVYMDDVNLHFKRLPQYTHNVIEEINSQLWSDTIRKYKVQSLEVMRRLAVGEGVYEKFLLLVDSYSKDITKPTRMQAIDILGEFADSYKHTDMHHKVSQLADSWFMLYNANQMNLNQINQGIREFNEHQKKRAVWVKYNYTNLQSLVFKMKQPVPYGTTGLVKVGVSDDNRCALAKVYRDEQLLGYVKKQFSGDKVITHDASSVNLERTMKALEKYKGYPFKFNVNDVQVGLTFKKFLFDYWNWCFNYGPSEKIEVMSLDDINLDAHVSRSSRKASPGIRMKKSGYKNKEDRFAEQIEIAKEFRKTTLNAKKVQDHYWGVIPVLKTHKIDEKKVRVALAPESYFHWNQFVLLYDFVEKRCVNCNVTDRFSPFFGDFDRDLHYVFLKSYMVESIDLVDMGGRIPTIVKDLFVEWYGEKMTLPEDRMMLRYLYNDIFDSKLIMPKGLGGDVLEKKSGYNDGPYGTNQFDTAAMKAYQAMNMWNNMLNNGCQLEPFSLLRIRTHGDNDIHGFPRNAKIFSWDVKFLESQLGQKVKELVISDNPVHHEYMGYKIRIESDVLGDRYVGFRPFGKTIKSLCMRDKFYRDPIQEQAYLAAIADCLILTDCWEDRSFALIQHVRAKYMGQRYARTTDQQEKLELLTKYGADNPRQTYWLDSKNDFIEDNWDDIFDYSEEKF